MPIPFQAEWLEADGLGGFTSGTVSGIRTRRYHALLLAATTPPTGRFVLVNGIEAEIVTSAGTFSLCSQTHVPSIDSFIIDPWPCWIFRLPGGVVVQQEILVPHERAAVLIRWRLLQGEGIADLTVRPMLTGRDYHALHHENTAFRFACEQASQKWTWKPYESVPGVVCRSNGTYQHDPNWVRQVRYIEEYNRGDEDTEDLASPGRFRWDLLKGDAVWVLTAEGIAGSLVDERPVEILTQDIQDRETRRRKGFPSLLHRAADAYLVRRGSGKTIIAGYPWFTDWGRDTFISLRGLCLAGGRLQDARDILIAWADTVSEGMLPNRFSDHGERAEYNAVDASLWFIIAVGDYFQAMLRAGLSVENDDRHRLRTAVEAILAGYAAGTRFGIRLDHDGLLAAGVPGVQLTWMDAKYRDWVVTPRIGKPVEIQALWLNALRIAGEWSAKWHASAEQGLRSFRERFWNQAGGYLYDVVDVDHVPMKVDDAFRPNQIFAVGGLPQALLEGDQARRVVDAVERRLWTPMGLRSLAPGSPEYAGRYEGDLKQRDGRYHQGTVWPWLIGPFVEAWLRVRTATASAKQEARQRFLEPLLTHVNEAGLGHISEIADGDEPHTPRGCPFQAWSVGEVLRVQASLLARV